MNSRLEKIKNPDEKIKFILEDGFFSDISAIDRLRLLNSVLANKKVRSFLSDKNNLPTLKEIKILHRYLTNQFALELREISKNLFFFFSKEDISNYKSGKENEIIEGSLSNKYKNLSKMVEIEISNAASMEERAILMESWIAIIRRSAELGDFPSVSGISNGLKPFIEKPEMRNIISPSARDVLDSFIFKGASTINNARYAYPLMANRQDVIIPDLQIYKEKIKSYTLLIDSDHKDKAEYIEKREELVKELLDMHAKISKIDRTVSPLQTMLVSEVDFFLQNNQIKNAKPEKIKPGSHVDTNQLFSNWLLSTLILDLHESQTLKNYPVLLEKIQIFSSKMKEDTIKLKEEIKKCAFEISSNNTDQYIMKIENVKSLSAQFPLYEYEGKEIKNSDEEEKIKKSLFIEKTERVRESYQMTLDVMKQLGEMKSNHQISNLINQLSELRSKISTSENLNQIEEIEKEVIKIHEENLEPLYKIRNVIFEAKEIFSKLKGDFDSWSNFKSKIVEEVCAEIESKSPSLRSEELRGILSSAKTASEFESKNSGVSKIKNMDLLCLSLTEKDEFFIKNLKDIQNALGMHRYISRELDNNSDAAHVLALIKSIVSLDSIGNEIMEAKKSIELTNKKEDEKIENADKAASEPEAKSRSSSSLSTASILRKLSSESGTPVSSFDNKKSQGADSFSEPSPIVNVQLQNENKEQKKESTEEAPTDIATITRKRR